MNMNNTKKNQNTNVIITLVCIVLIAVSVVAIIFAGEVLLNKNSNTEYADIGSTEKLMLFTVKQYLEENKLKLDKPIAFVKDNGLMRGRAYVFNVPLTENKLNLNLNGGAYSTEIILPDEYDFPTMYRCSTFAPSIGSLLFPSNYSTKKLCGEEVYVISFNESSIKDGSFVTLLDKVYGK